MPNMIRYDLAKDWEFGTWSLIKGPGTYSLRTTLSPFTHSMKDLNCQPSSNHNLQSTVTICFIICL